MIALLEKKALGPLLPRCSASRTALDWRPVMLLQDGIVTRGHMLTCIVSSKTMQIRSVQAQLGSNNKLAPTLRIQDPGRFIVPRLRCYYTCCSNRLSVYVTTLKKITTLNARCRPAAS